MAQLTHTRYAAIITQGDNLHPTGETYYISNSEVEKIKKDGIHFHESSVGPDGAHVYYPCKIVKRVFILDNEETIGISERSNIVTNYCEDTSYDWKDHWC